MVTLYVGPKRKAYYVHQALICDRSAYFRTMFEGDSREARAKKVYLAEEKDTAVELFVTWIYGTVLMGPLSSKELSSYLSLLVLSERFLIEQLHNERADHLRRFQRCLGLEVSAENLKYSYENVSDLRIGHDLARMAARVLLQGGPASFPEDLRGLISNGDPL